MAAMLTTGVSYRGRWGLQGTLFISAQEAIARVLRLTWYRCSNCNLAVSCAVSTYELSSRTSQSASQLWSWYIIYYPKGEDLAVPSQVTTRYEY